MHSTPALDELLEIRRFIIESENSMRLFGHKLSSALPEQCLITLSGELGAGKSVLARSIIHSLGYEGRVKSPTYTLIETYNVTNADGVSVQVAHLDLYRLSDPEELDYLAFDDVLQESSLVLIEWAELGGDRVPADALHVHIDYAGDDSRIIELAIAQKPS